MATKERKQALVDAIVTDIVTTVEFNPEPLDIGTEAYPHFVNGYGTQCKKTATTTEEEAVATLEVNVAETVSYIFKTLDFKKWFKTKDDKDLKKIVINLVWLLRHTKYIDKNLFPCIIAILDGEASFDVYKYAIAEYVNKNETEKLADLTEVLSFWGDRSNKDPRK